MGKGRGRKTEEKIRMKNGGQQLTEREENNYFHERTRILTLKIDDDVYNEIEKEAIKRGISRSELIREIIREMVKREIEKEESVHVAKVFKIKIT